MAKPTTSREFAHEDLAVLPGVGGDKIAADYWPSSNDSSGNVSVGS